MNDDYIFDRRSIESWQHSEACLTSEDKNKCLCGLTALQALVERKAPRKPFTLHVGDVPPRSSCASCGKPRMAGIHAVSP